MASYWSGSSDPQFRSLWGNGQAPPPVVMSQPGAKQDQAASDLAAVEEAKRRIKELTEGRAQELANDPYQKAVLDYLQGVMGGQNAPYSDTVKNSLMAQQGAGAAAAEAAQMEALRESLAASGGSIYDPGYQAAQREAMSKRQAANLNAQGQINSMAELENARARMAGAGQLASVRGAQNSQINQMNMAGADYRSRQTAAVPTQPPAAAPTQNAPMTASKPINPVDMAQQMSRQNRAAFRVTGRGI